MRLDQRILDAEMIFSNKNQTYRKASLLKRFFNLVIDYMAILHFSIFVGVLLGIVFVGFGKKEWLEVLKNSYINLAISWAVIFIYYVICEYLLEGKTLGKFITKTSVKNISGRAASLNDIMIRTAFRLIPFEPISFLFGKDQSWHDAFSYTMVVDDH